MKKCNIRVIYLFLLALISSLSSAYAGEIIVKDANSFYEAVKHAQPGTTILVASGAYEGVFYFENIKGTADRPVVIAAQDPANPPHIVSTHEGMHFVDAEYLEVRDLVIDDWRENGFHVDDGGSFETPSRHIVLKNITIRGGGNEKGIFHGIKLTGVVEFVLENCVVENWPSGGAGINMLGSHEGVVTGCTVRNSAGRGEMGLQTKGGTSDILITKNRFLNAGLKALSLGGSTGLSGFRPPFQGYEAKNIWVEGNLIVGSESAIVFASSEDVTVRFNTIYLPEKWAVRILQDNTSPGSIPCRNGTFTDNIVVFQSGWLQGGINIGKGTAPETFRFARNAWYCENRPGRSQPYLPTLEEDGIYGQDPLLRSPSENDFSLQDGSPAIGKGHTALKK